MLVSVCGAVVVVVLMWLLFDVPVEGVCCLVSFVAVCRRARLLLLLLCWWRGCDWSRCWLSLMCGGADACCWKCCGSCKRLLLLVLLSCLVVDGCSRCFVV